MQEMPKDLGHSLDGEDPLEKGITTHSSILAWEIPGTEEPGGLQSTESQRIKHILTSLLFSKLWKEVLTKPSFKKRIILFNIVIHI